MRRKIKANAVIFSAATTAVMLLAAGSLHAQSVEISQYSGDNFTTGNWNNDITGAPVGTSTGNNLLVPNDFGTHAGVNVLAGSGFTVPNSSSTPPGGLTSFTIAAVFKPTASVTTGGFIYQAQCIYGYDIGGGGVPDFGLGFGGSSGTSVIAGVGQAPGGSDQTLTSGALALNVPHSAVYQVEDANGVAGAGVITLYVDGILAQQTTGLTIQPMNPGHSNISQFGLGGNFGNGKFQGDLGLVQVYNDSNGVINGQALSASLVQSYGGTDQAFTFNVSNGAFSSGSSYVNGISPAADPYAQVEISNGGTATISSSDTIGITSLLVGDSNGTHIGNITQTGGTISVSGSFFLGQANATGTYSITGGSLTYTGGALFEIQGNAITPSVLTIGSGTGTATVTTGPNSGNTSIGEGAGASGVVNVLAGGTYLSNNGETWIGNNGGVGVLNVSGGTVTVNNWLAPGRLGGTGTVYLSSGSITKTNNSNGNVIIGGDGPGSHGYFYQTGGTFAANTSPLTLAEVGGDAGVFNISNNAVATVGSVQDGQGGVGTINVGGTASFTSLGLTEVGRDSGSNGTLNVSGGTYTTNGLTAHFGPAAVNISGTGSVTSVASAPSTVIGDGGGSSASLNVATGGSFTSASSETWIGNNGAVGVLNVSGGTVTVSNWLAPGRLGGTGTVYLSGGSITKTNGSNGSIDFGGDGAGSVGYFYQTGGALVAPTDTVILAENGANGATPADIGTWNMSGGTANVKSIQVGDGGNGTLNVSGTSQITAFSVVGGVNSGANGTININGGSVVSNSVVLGTVSGASGTLNLNAGATLTTAGISIGTGTGAININGGTLQALQNSSAFITAPSAGQVQISNGATIDTQAFNVGVQTTLQGSGGLNKIGTGTLTLAASNSYSGDTHVNAGTLAVANSNALGSGSAILANHTTLALTAQAPVISFSQFYTNNQTPIFVPTVSSNQTALTLTPPVNNASVSVFNSSPTTINDATGFVASFTYHHASFGPEESGADGIVFVLQSTNGTGNAVAGAGSSIGYAGGGTAFQNSVAASVDLFLDRLQTGAGNGSNSSFTNVPAENSSPIISQSTASNVTIVYNGTTQTLTETITSLANGSSSSITTTGVDASQLLGGPAGGSQTAFVGFTSATGGANDLQSISDFTFNSLGQTPVAATSAVAFTNPVIVSPGASSTLQLAPTAMFSSGSVGPITISNGSNLAITVGASPAAGVTHGVLATPSVTFLNSSHGTLDLGNNALDITTSGSYATVSTQIKSGYHNGTWTGPGIISSAAASNASKLTTLGVIVNSVDGTGNGTPLYGSGAALGLFEGTNPASSDTLVKYTYYGDTNLNGAVDGSDYSRVDSTYLAEHFVNGSATTPISGWYNGDFNYDGVVNGSDYTLIDNAFNQQGAQIADQVATPTALVAGGGSSAVPEPATLGLLAVGAAGLLGRRRRHH